MSKLLRKLRSKISLASAKASKTDVAEESEETRSKSPEEPKAGSKVFKQAQTSSAKNIVKYKKKSGEEEEEEKVLEAEEMQEEEKTSDGTMKTCCCLHRFMEEYCRTTFGMRTDQNTQQRADSCQPPCQPPCQLPCRPPCQPPCQKGHPPKVSGKAHCPDKDKDKDRADCSCLSPETRRVLAEIIGSLCKARAEGDAEEKRCSKSSSLRPTVDEACQADQPKTNDRKDNISDLCRSSLEKKAKSPDVCMTREDRIRVNEEIIRTLDDIFDVLNCSCVYFKMNMAGQETETEPTKTCEDHLPPLMSNVSEPYTEDRRCQRFTCCMTDYV